MSLPSAYYYNQYYDTSFDPRLPLALLPIMVGRRRVFLDTSYHTISSSNFDLFSSVTDVDK